MMIRLLILFLLLTCTLSLNIFSTKKISSSSVIPDLKKKLITLAKNTNNGIDANIKLRSSIDDVVKQLEKVNPTK